MAVHWQAVKNADRYTVTFTKAMEKAQERQCPDSSHNTHVSVNTTTTIGHRPRCSMETYFITVIAESDKLGTI